MRLAFLSSSFRLDAINAGKDEERKAKRKRNRLADASEKFKVVA